MKETYGSPVTQPILRDDELQSLPYWDIMMYGWLDKLVG